MKHAKKLKPRKISTPAAPVKTSRAPEMPAKPKGAGVLNPGKSLKK